MQTKSKRTNHDRIERNDCGKCICLYSTITRLLSKYFEFHIRCYKMCLQLQSSADLAVNCVVTGFLLRRVAVVVLLRVIIHVWGAI